MSLNPRMTVGGLIGEGLAIHNIGKPKERPARVAELMDLVGLRREHGLALPARVLRRPATADRDRPGARARARS